MSDAEDKDAMYRAHARRMVADGLTNAQIGHEIMVSYDEAVRHRVRQHVLDFQGQGLGRPTGPEWQAIVRAYRATGDKRPSQMEVAEGMSVSERTLALKLRALKIERWDDVHAWIATED